MSCNGSTPMVEIRLAGIRICSEKVVVYGMSTHPILVWTQTVVGKVILCTGIWLYLFLNVFTYFTVDRSNRNKSIYFILHKKQLFSIFRQIFNLCTDASNGRHFFNVV